MERNQWTDKPFDAAMGAEMVELLKDQDNLTDYNRTHRLVTSTLLVKRNVQARGTTQAHHINTQNQIDVILAAIDNYDMLTRSRFETQAVDKHNKLVDDTGKELEKLTRQAVKAAEKVLTLTRKMVKIQDKAIASSKTLQPLNGRGHVYFIATWDYHRLAWGYTFNAVLPPRELSIHMAKSVLIRTDMYNADAEKVIKMAPAIIKYSHDHANQG